MTSEAQKRASKKWRSKNQQRLRDYDRDRYPKRKGYLIRKGAERDRELYSEVDRLLGKKCVFCGRERKRIYRHEIHGKEHPMDPRYILAHIEDFIPVCGTCHRCLHWAMKYLKVVYGEQ